jgi:hypothetical protein
MRQRAKEKEGSVKKETSKCERLMREVEKG